MRGVCYGKELDGKREGRIENANKRSAEFIPCCNQRNSICAGKFGQSFDVGIDTEFAKNFIAPEVSHNQTSWAPASK